MVIANGDGRRKTFIARENNSNLPFNFRNNVECPSILPFSHYICLTHLFFDKNYFIYFSFSHSSEYTT